MASPPIKPLDGPGEYLRWKESLLLHAHTLGVSHVLVEGWPADEEGDEAAAEKWVHDDGLCRGHILAALSDSLLPDYARFATAADLWCALARTYNVPTRSVWKDRFDEFRFDESRDGSHFLEQLAHAQAMGVAAGLSDAAVAAGLRGKLPPGMGKAVVQLSGLILRETCMEMIWDFARCIVSNASEPEVLWAAAQDQEEQGCNLAEDTARRNRDEPGHTVRNSKRRR